MEEDPAPADLAGREQSAAGVFEDGGDRHVQQLGDLSSVEDVFAGKARPDRGLGMGAHRLQGSSSCACI